MKIEEQKRQHANKVADANVMRKETLEASVVDQLETLANIIREKLLGTMPTDLAPCQSPALASNSFYR